jgi:TP901 family phage tail tape measure protein
MTGQTYQVNYIVNVDAANAQSAINAFKRAVSSMDKATRPIMDLQNKVRGLVETMSALNKGKYSVKIDTKPATQKIGKLIRALQMAKAEVQQLNAMGVTLGGVGNKGKSISHTTTSSTIAGATKQAHTSSLSRSGTPKQSSKGNNTFLTKHPTNLGYKVWGPTPLPNNGGMAIDMLKGMGIAYGLSGAGMLISDVFSEATEYDNIMKTVENILKSHDNEENFAGRFAHMTQVIRNVGMKTKFKMTEVADAARFLSMAGLNADAIQQSISPIADIALVGDTELGETADVVTNIMTAYNIAPSKMRNAADIMTNTFTMSNTTLMEIAEAYKYAASLLSAGGISFEEATAAIGVLGDAGIKSSQAGTTMRTIMANIANPTKKQQEGWDAIGIKLTDEFGKRKDLLQVFQELNAKNLDVDDFYRIFHKTAASGAVALAAHADKWETIYLENFLASGMTRRLAEEKQNTFQGLWAQLTSVFTDQGVTAFNSVQGGLRAWMKMAIDWMDPNKNPDAQKAFKEVANALMEFIQVIIDASKWFIWFFDKFGAIIKMWAKFQLMIWPVVKAVTALRSVFLGLLGLRKVSSVVLGLSSAFGNLNKSLLLFGRNWANGNWMKRAIGNTAIFLSQTSPFGVTGASVPNGIVGGAMLGGIVPLSHRQYMKAAKGLDLSRPHASTSGYYLNRIDNLGREAEVAAWNSGVYANRQAEDKAALNRYRQNRKEFNRRVRNLQIKNGALGLGKMGVGALGTMVGMHQMTKDNANVWDVASGGLLSAAGMAAMVGGPAGWIAAAGLSLGALGTSFVSFNKNLDALSGFVDDFTKSHQLLDGALLNGKTRTERYLEFVWRKNYDINDLIQRRTELMKELLGLETPNATTTKDIGNETYKTMYERFYAADSMWGSSGAAKNAADMFNKNGKQFGLSIDEHVETYGYDPRTGAPITETYWAYKDANGNIIKFANPDGSSDTNDAVMYDVAAAMEMLHGQYRSKIIDENQKRLALMLYGKSTVADVKNWRDTFASTYGPSSWDNKIRPNQWNEDTDVAKYWSGEDIAQSYIGSQLLWASMYQIVEAQNAIADFKEKMANGNLTENDVVRALRWGDYDILGETLADYNPNDITGWFRNMGYAGDGVWRDPSGRETPEAMAQTAAGHMQRILESIKKLGLEADPATQFLQQSANTLLSFAQSFMKQNNISSGSTGNGTNELNAQITNGIGAQSSDYKSHYKERAIPKQININIQNLMKVDSIDLTNADNVAIIDRMKREVAYALYEAAADGTMMLNGLSNT